MAEPLTERYRYSVVGSDHTGGWSTIYSLGTVDMDYARRSLALARNESPERQIRLERQAVTVTSPWDVVDV